MLSLFYCFVVIFVVCAIVFVIWYFTNYKDAKSGCVSKITFKRFQALYSINPHNWNTDRSLYVSYNPTNSRGVSYMYHFYFPVFDTLRYYIWRKKDKASIENAYNRQMMESVIKFWRHDIRKYCEDNSIPIKEYEDSKIDFKHGENADLSACENIFDEGETTMKRKMAVVVRHYSKANSGEVRAVFDTLDEAKQFIIDNTEDLPEGDEYYVYYGMYDAPEESDGKGQ